MGALHPSEFHSARLSFPFLRIPFFDVLLNDKTLTRRRAAPEGPLESQWKTSVITTPLNGSQMDIQLLIGMVDGVHLKLLGAEGTLQTQ